jgi:hypothetical protein
MEKVQNVRNVHFQKLFIFLKMFRLQKSSIFYKKDQISKYVQI